MSKRFFQAGGSLGTGLPSYIERQADHDLYNHLKLGDFCYVLTARQVGKSSLKVRTMGRLAQEGWATASVDLNAFGATAFTAEQWYKSFLLEIADALGIDDAFENWWEDNLGLTPVARMSAFWREVVLKETTEKVAILIDEVDNMLSLDEHIFSTDDFFAAIRAAYNRRSKSPDFQRLNFAIFGVAAPKDLMSDHERTPFNIGVPIPLQNFTLEEATPLQAGLANDEPTNQAILEQVLYWTGGQPYLTQEMGQILSEIKCKLGEVPQVVDQAVTKVFFRADIFNNAHFSNIQKRILANEPYNQRMLDIYKGILQKGTFTSTQKGDEQLYLKLSGLVREENGTLLVNNRIYTHIFDHEWLQKAYGSINRPFTLDLQRWLNSGRSKDALLIGTVLQEAETWAAAREDLTNPERDFLQASRMAEVEAEQERRMQVERDRQRRRLQLALAVAVVAAIVATIAGVYGFRQAAIAEARTEEANKQTEITKIQREKAEAETKRAEQEKQTADSLRKEAEDRLAEIERQKGIISREQQARLTEEQKRLAAERRTVNSRIAEIEALLKVNDTIEARKLLKEALYIAPGHSDLLKIKKKLN